MLYFIHLNEKVNNQASFSKHKWYKQFNSILKSKMPNCTKVIFPIKQLLLIKLQKINSFQFHFPIPKFPAFHFLERYKISISSNCFSSRFKFLLFPLLRKKFDHHYIFDNKAIYRQSIYRIPGTRTFFQSWELLSKKISFSFEYCYTAHPFKIFWQSQTSISAPLNICLIFATCQSHVSLS